MPTTPPCNHSAGGKEGENKEEIGKGKQQIIESKRRLMRVKYRTDQDVSSVRVAGDDRENQHRIQEEQTRQVGAGLRGGGLSVEMGAAGWKEQTRQVGAG